MSETGARGFCVRPGEGEPLAVIGGEVLLGERASGGRLVVLHSRAPAGDHVPTHVHHDVDECFYVLEGEYTVTCGPDTVTAGPGALVHLPRGEPHGYRLGEGAGSKLIIGVPGALEGFFRALDAEEVDLDVLRHRHGVTFL